MGGAGEVLAAREGEKDQQLTVFAAIVRLCLVLPSLLYKWAAINSCANGILAFLLRVRLLFAAVMLECCVLFDGL